MFCPLCKAEYREGFLKCADCQVDLVNALPIDPEPPGKFRLVRLWRGADPVFYSALTAALQEANIPFFDNPPRDYENWLSAREWTGLDMGVPNLDIQVPEPRFTEADSILRTLLETSEIRQGQDNVSEEE